MYLTIEFVSVSFHRISGEEGEKSAHVRSMTNMVACNTCFVVSGNCDVKYSIMSGSSYMYWGIVLLINACGTHDCMTI